LPLKGSSAAKENISSFTVTEPIIWKNYSKIKGKGNWWIIGRGEMGTIFIIYFAFAALEQILFQPIKNKNG